LISIFSPCFGVFEGEHRRSWGFSCFFGIWHLGSLLFLLKRLVLFFFLRYASVVGKLYSSVHIEIADVHDSPLTD